MASAISSNACIWHITFRDLAVSPYASWACAVTAQAQLAYGFISAPWHNFILPAKMRKHIFLPMFCRNDKAPPIIRFAGKLSQPRVLSRRCFSRPLPSPFHSPVVCPLTSLRTPPGPLPPPQGRPRVLAPVLPSDSARCGRCPDSPLQVRPLGAAERQRVRAQQRGGHRTTTQRQRLSQDSGKDRGRDRTI